MLNVDDKSLDALQEGRTRAHICRDGLVFWRRAKTDQTRNMHHVKAR